jgi:hypothetical protein
MMRKPDDEDKFRMLSRLQVAALIGVAFIIVYSLRFWRTGALASIIGVGILAAGAFLLTGFLLGFIFGIPRTSKDSGGQSPAGSAPGGTPPDASHKNAVGAGNSGIEPNSNLVEISDWLTKIIVGVGLVQLNRIPGRIQDLTTYIGNGLRPCDSEMCRQSSEAFALGIILFFFCVGFLIGYLWARLYLPYALAKAQSATQVDTGWTYADWADQAYDAGDYDKANHWIDMALQTDPSNAKSHLLKGMILKKRAQKPGKPVDKGLLQQALDEATKAAKLKKDFAAAFYNIACYKALLGGAKAEVLENLSRAFELNSNLKADASGDDDLASVRDDADFKRLTA